MDEDKLHKKETRLEAESYKLFQKSQQLRALEEKLTLQHQTLAEGRLKLAQDRQALEEEKEAFQAEQERFFQQAGDNWVKKVGKDGAPATKQPLSEYDKSEEGIIELLSKATGFRWEAVNKGATFVAFRKDNDMSKKQMKSVIVALREHASPNFSETQGGIGITKASITKRLPKLKDNADKIYEAVAKAMDQQREI